MPPPSSTLAVVLVDRCLDLASPLTAGGDHWLDAAFATLRRGGQQRETQEQFCEGGGNGAPPAASTGHLLAVTGAGAAPAAAQPQAGAGPCGAVAGGAALPGAVGALPTSPPAPLPPSIPWQRVDLRVDLAAQVSPSSRSAGMSFTLTLDYAVLPAELYTIHHIHELHEPLTGGSVFRKVPVVEF